MKIFIPVPDDVLMDHPGAMERLVPFKPEYMTENRLKKEGSKPRNWVSDSDYTSACARLNAARQESATVAAVS